jgi:hypothetical protein
MWDSLITSRYRRGANDDAWSLLSMVCATVVDDDDDEDDMIL